MAVLDGNIAKFTVNFYDTATNALVDPTGVGFQYRMGNGAYSASVLYSGSSTPALNTVAKTGVGIYVYWLDTTSLGAGILQALATGTGTHAATATDSVTLGASGGVGSDMVFGDLIETTYRRLVSGIRERAVQVNQSTGMGSLDTTVVLSGDQTNQIFPGVILSVDLEVMYCTGWNSGTNTATVVRGYFNSVKAPHLNSALVYINSRFTRFDIAKAINDDLASLSSPNNGLYRVGVGKVVWNPVKMGYDLGMLPDNYMDILEVRYRIPTPSQNFPPIPRDMWAKVQWDQVNTDPLFPSGQGLILYQGAYPGMNVYVTYSVPFLPLSDVNDSVWNTPVVNDPAPPYSGYGTTVTVQNLWTTMTDIPPLGAAIALSQPREVSRNFMENQPDARKAQEVPPGAVMNSTQALVVRRQARIQEEADRLDSIYGTAR